MSVNNPGVVSGKVIYVFEGHQPWPYTLRRQTLQEGAMEVLAMLLARPTEMNQETGATQPTIQLTDWDDVSRTAQFTLL